jgi:hypothetical protein
LEQYRIRRDAKLTVFGVAEREDLSRVGQGKGVEGTACEFSDLLFEHSEQLAGLGIVLVVGVQAEFSMFSGSPDVAHIALIDGYRSIHTEEDPVNLGLTEVLDEFRHEIVLI